MNGDNRNLAIGQASRDGRVGAGSEARTSQAGDAESRGARAAWPWINWGLALSTVPAAAIVMLFALGAVMSSDSCGDGGCPGMGRGGIDFGVAFYGPPAVTLAVIVVSVFTAKRKGGVVVPLCGWALLVADVAIMAATVAQ